MKIILTILLAVFLSSCSTHSPVKLGNSSHDNNIPDIILIPMEGFNVYDINNIATTIEKTHNLKVKVFTTLGISPAMFSSIKQQYISEEIAKSAFRSIQNYGVNHKNTTTIVLTKFDINTSDFRLRYNFSTHFNQIKLSVISTARIDPVNFDQEPDKDLVLDRLEKLIYKAIGTHHFHYPISSEKSSVIFGPMYESI